MSHPAVAVLSFRAIAGAALATAALGITTSGSSSPFWRAPGAAPQEVQVPYNGDFTFTRVRYGGGGFGGFGRGGGGGQWNHDYPIADENMELILRDFTAMHPNVRSNVLDLEDPEIFRSPILYLSEPGTWGISPEGAKNLREHLLKGGLIIFDDFDGPGHWENWLEQIQRALPEYRPIEITGTHPIYDTFFYIRDIYLPHPLNGTRPTYLGIFEDNDPNKRMMAIINYNQDLGEAWEYAARGLFPVDVTNDAFRLGVNYIIWGLSR